MFQSIAISPLFFSNISEDGKSVFEILDLLETETILSDIDKSILDEYIEVIPQITNQYVQLWLKEFQNHSTLTGKNIKIIKDVKASIRTQKDQQSLKTEIALANANTDWKIILSDSSTELKFKFNNSSKNILKEAELISPNLYLNPNEESQLINASSIISKKKGDKFNLVSWLKKYLMSTTKIELKDGYLQSPRALKNLGKILGEIGSIDSKLPVEIVTMTDKARNIKYDRKKKMHVIVDDGIVIKNEITSLVKTKKNENLFITFIDEKININDRNLQTDNFFISLGHSLDAVTENNDVVKQFDIVVTKK